MNELQRVRLVWFWVGVLTTWISFAAGWWLERLMR